MSDVVKYLNDLAKSNNALQIMVFDDDSIEVQFKDCTSLQLSPCGSCYQYNHNDTTLPVTFKTNSVTRRRCCFATSETKAKVEFAILWRNHFAQRPYLPSHFQHLYQNADHQHIDITSYTWPDQDILKDNIFRDKNVHKDVIVDANNQFAKLTLCKTGLMCKVDCLIKLNPSNYCPVSSSRLQKNGGKSVDDQIKMSGTPRKYVYLKHIFPSGACPPFWKYPFSLAFQIVNKDLIETEYMKKVDIKNLINTSHAPQPIPTICNKQFSHIWRINSKPHDTGLHLPMDVLKQSDKDSQSWGRSIKALWNADVMYWIIHNLDVCGVVLEAWLPDGSVVISKSSTNCYFSHLEFDDTNTIKSKRVYSTSTLPMNVDLKTVILRAIRLYSYAEHVLSVYSSKFKKVFCWQENIYGFGNLNVVEDDDDCQESKRFDTLCETVDVRGLGKFTCLKGSVQIKFEDGTILYVTLGQSEFTSLQSSSEALSSIFCRLLFPKGQFLDSISLTQTDSHIFNYLKPACDWLQWLATTNDYKLMHPFYSDTIFSSEKLSMISFELEKIKRFNFINDENSSVCFEPDLNSHSIVNTSCKSSDISNASSCSNKSSQGSKNNSSSMLFTPNDIDNVVKNTSQAISDIDNLIANLRNKA